MDSVPSLREPDLAVGSPPAPMGGIARGLGGRWQLSPRQPCRGRGYGLAPQGKGDVAWSQPGPMRGRGHGPAPVCPYRGMGGKEEGANEVAEKEVWPGPMEGQGA